MYSWQSDHRGNVQFSLFHIKHMYSHYDSLLLMLTLIESWTIYINYFDYLSTRVSTIFSHLFVCFYQYSWICIYILCYNPIIIFLLKLSQLCPLGAFLVDSCVSFNMPVLPFVYICLALSYILALWNSYLSCPGPRIRKYPRNSSFF